MLQGFLLLEPLTLAGWGSRPSIYLPALLGPSLPPGQWLGMRRVNKKWVLGDTGRAHFLCCGVRPTPGCEVAGTLTTPLSTGQRGAHVAVFGFVSGTEAVRSSGEKEQAVSRCFWGQELIEP